MEQMHTLQKPKIVSNLKQKSSHQINIQNYNQQQAFNSHQIEQTNSYDNTPISNNNTHEGISPFRQATGKFSKRQNYHLSVNRGSHISEANKQSNKNLDKINFDHQQEIKQDIILGKRFQLSLENQKNKVGLFIGRDTMLKQEVAIKLFGGKKPKTNKSQQQFYVQEREILLKLRNHEGFSRIIESGYEEECDIFYIIMQKLDFDFNTIVKKAEGGRLSLQTVVNFGIQMIARLEKLHELGIVHRDLKPKNIMLNQKENEIILIDFGLSNKFKSQYQTHIQFRNTKKLLGTPLYASNNALLGKEISRRDDIESLIYILIFALKGNLPWKGQLKLEFLKSPSVKQKLQEWRNPYGELCQDIEPEFREMLDYAQKLEFEEEPDYEYLESLLTVIKERYDFDDTFDWTNSNQMGFGQSNSSFQHDRIQKTKIVIQEEEQIDMQYEQQHEQNQNYLHLNMASELRSTMKKNVKYRTVRKLKKGTSGVHNVKNIENELNISLQPSQNGQSDISQNSNQKNQLLKVKRQGHSKKRTKISSKIVSPNITDILQTPDITKTINSNDVSNNVSQNGDAMIDKSNVSQDHIELNDNIRRSQSIQLNFNSQNCQDKPQYNIVVNVSSDNECSQDDQIPSEDQHCFSQILNGTGDCSGTAGIDFNHNKYWDQDSLDEGLSIIKQVPEFNNKRTIIQRKSEIINSRVVSPVRLSKLNSHSAMEQIIAQLNQTLNNQNSQ